MTRVVGTSCGRRPLRTAVQLVAALRLAGQAVHDPVPPPSSVETLFWHGEADATTPPAELRKIADRYPHHALVLLRAASHEGGSEYQEAQLFERELAFFGGAALQPGYSHLDIAP